MTDHRAAINATIPPKGAEQGKWCTDAIEAVADVLVSNSARHLDLALEAFGLAYQLGRVRIAKMITEVPAPNPDAPDAV